MPRPQRLERENTEDYWARVGMWEATPDGIATRALEARKAAADAIEAAERQRTDARKAAGIPERYAHMDALIPPRQTQATMAIAEAGSFELLALSGAIGCGKTAAACWWLTRVTGGRFVTAAGLSRISKWGDEVKEFVRCPRLVLDDLGVEYVDNAGFFLSLLDDLVNERYACRRPTILTTNLDVEKFKARYGERIADRIREAGEFVSLSNASLRRRAG